MELPSDLISEFIKAATPEPTTKKETIMYGTIHYDGKTWVQLDGSELYTPLSTTADVKDGDRVTVVVKDHTAIVTGNLSDPSASSGTVTQVEVKIVEMDNVIANKVSTDELYAESARIEKLIVSGDLTVLGELKAAEADIGKLEADNAIINETLVANEAEFKRIETEKLSVKDAEIKFATIDNLEALTGEFVSLRATYGNFEQLTTNKITSVEADIGNLEANKLSVADANVKYANIDFANIGEAAVRKIFADSGIIKELATNDAFITGELVGVTVSADSIKTNTLTVDKLVVRGSDGKYYAVSTDFSKLSGVEPVDEDSIHGSTIVANSVTAEKIRVEDLVAFGATIGGFNITDHSLYSGVKSSIDNSDKGTYLDTLGQFNIGDSTRYLKYYHISMGEATVSNGVLIATEKTAGTVSYYNEDGVAHFVDTTHSMDVDASFKNSILSLHVGTYKLEISAESILFGGGSRNSLADLEDITKNVKIGTWTDPITGDTDPSIELSEGESDFKQIITNKASRIVDGENIITEMDPDGVTTENMTVRNEIRQGQWAWVQHGRGNLGLMWKEVTG